MSASRPPWVTFSLVAANIAAAYLLTFSPDLLLQLGFDPKNPNAWTIFTCLFLHANLWHLLGNMVFLAAVGPAVEAASGKRRFAAVFLLGGMAGVLLHFVLTRTQPEAPILIGASGGVASLIAYYNLRNVHLQVHLAPKVGVSVLAVTLLWLVLQGVGAFGGGERVSFWAHIGGFVAGVLLGFLFRAPKQADRQLGQAVIGRQESASRVVAAADWHLGEHPDDLEGMRRKAEALADLGEDEEEGAVRVAMMALLPENEQEANLARLVKIGQIGRLPAQRRLREAERFPRLAKNLLLSVIADPKEPRRPEALLDLIPLSDTEEAQMWRHELETAYPLHPATELARSRGYL